MLSTRTFGERAPLVAKPTELRVTDLAVSFWPTGPGPVFRDYIGVFSGRFGSAVIFRKIAKSG